MFVDGTAPRPGSLSPGDRTTGAVDGRRRSPRTAGPVPGRRLRLVHLYADQGSPKFDRAALRWLGRYLDEGSPTLAQFAKVTATLAAKDPTSTASA